METQIYLLRSMSDTVETDIHRVHIIANEVLARYRKAALSWEELRKIADGPFDLFLIPLIFREEFESDHISSLTRQGGKKLGPTRWRSRASMDSTRSRRR